MTPEPQTAEAAPFATILARLLRRRRLWLAWIVGGIVLGAAIALVLGPTYTAEAIFAPQAEKQSGIAGLAAQFGIDVSGLTQNDPVGYYVTLLTSDDLLWDLATHEYRFATAPSGSDTLSGTLVDLYHMQASSPDKLRRKMMTRLKRDITESVDTRDNIVTLRVSAPWAALAEQMADQALVLVNQFNLEKRQSRARAEREFLESRQTAAAAELAQSEDSLQTFLMHNARYADSPELRFQEQRLERAVQFRQQVMTSIAQSYERARIDEVRNTPLITIIQQPAHTAKHHRGPLFGAVLGLVAGAFVGLLILVIEWYLTRQRQRYPVAYAELDDARREAVAGLRRLPRGRRPRN